MESENLINQIDMSKLEHDSCKKIYTDNIRFEFNSLGSEARRIFEFIKRDLIFFVICDVEMPFV